MISSRLISLFAIFAAPVPAWSQGSGDLLVTSRFSDAVLRYDGATGAFLGVFADGGGLDNPVGLTYGPDGDLYVASAVTNSVLRYDGVTGDFVAALPGVDDPRNVSFGPDGALYAASAGSNRILRWNASDGVFEAFASGGGLSGPTSFTFGPDGDLYVVSVLTDRIKRYDGTSGAFLGNFVTTHLNGPHDLVFAPDGELYVTNAGGIRIRRFDAETGVFLGNFTTDSALSFALGFVFDRAGFVYVANQGTDEVLRYDAETGAPLGSLVTPGAGGLDGPLFMVFARDPSGWRVRAPYPGVAGVRNTVELTGGTPGALVALSIGDARVAWLPPSCGGRTTVMLPIWSVPLVADEAGRAMWSANVPLSLAGMGFGLQGVGGGGCEATDVVRVGF